MVQALEQPPQRSHFSSPTASAFSIRQDVGLTCRFAAFNSSRPPHAMPSTDVPPPQTAPSSDVPSAGASTVELKITHEEVVSFARQQAGIPLLHRLELTHRGTAPLRGAVIRILPEPGFADPKEVRLADLEAGAELVLGDLELDLTLSPAYLSSQRERVAGRLLVRVEAGGGVLAEQSLPLAVLAYNEWSGLGSRPRYWRPS
jgi:hypothetical protein